MKNALPSYIQQSFSIVFGIVLGSILTVGVSSISAQSIGTINGCIRPLTSLLRIIGDNETCNANETPISWNQSSGSDEPKFGDFITTNLSNIDAEQFNTDFAFRNFRNGNFSSSNLSSNVLDYSDFSNSDFTNCLLQNQGASAKFTKFTNVDFTGCANISGNFEQANFDGAILSGVPWGMNVTSASFVNAQLTNTQIIDTNLTDANMSGANFSNSEFLIDTTPTTIQNTNLTNVNFSNANLNGIDFTSSTRTGIIWHNTTCPDGTNSDDNGNTCEGHLSP